MPGVRTLVAWYPDWPVVAAGHPPERPVAVVSANRVVACSPEARAEGVVQGLRRREAQGRCPELLVVQADPSRDLRAWEPAVMAVEALTPMVEVVRAGMLALATRGPSRYYGGDRALAGLMAQAIDTAVAASGVRGSGTLIGVADGRFAAELAARAVSARPAASGAAADAPVCVVPPGASATWLAPLPVTALDRPELTGLWARLGLRTLGEVAALDQRAVLARFGTEGADAHRLARGLDERPPAARVPPPDLAVSAVLDPPAERVDTVAFVARTLAEELHGRLAALGLACTRLAVEAETEHGEHLQRLWRHDGALTAGAVAERVRWQLDGWLRSQGDAGGTSGGLSLLRLRPDEIRPDHGRQLGFWGGSAQGDARVARALARVQGLLGPDGVVTAVIGGGRDPAEQVRLVPWGDERVQGRPAAWTPVSASRASAPPVSATPASASRASTARASASPASTARASASPASATRASTARASASRASAGTGRPARAPVELPPWPGRLPGPAPAVVHHPALPAEVRDREGNVVGVTGRGELSGAPATVTIAGAPVLEVKAWAGPWPIEERWWDDKGRRRARLQVVLSDGCARLLSREGGRWGVDATYD
ncbi:DNA polymerase Y family protein [Acidiferrimicrobium sp. IK]|uniref:DNA polymerase Y family protein n=1 Tax=Acidiferrimicrobium sp. IK TaxID=2871700 RepID=UPI0021CB8587|nr:DNA polymerase Y family protein [Acidiferrimicrobium sp. IK]MCU4184132.1 DNA polymerase Y family protein [Acidiferrimicrobium sp. IK]